MRFRVENRLLNRLPKRSTAYLLHDVSCLCRKKAPHGQTAAWSYLRGVRRILCPLLRHRNCRGREASCTALRATLLQGRPVLRFEWKVSKAAARTHLAHQQRTGSFALETAGDHGGGVLGA